MATASQIQQLYVAYFGRPADPNGLASWLTSTASLTQIAQSFGTAPEFTTAFAGQTYAQQVNNLYLNLFGRSAEPAGLNAWVAELNSGRLTLAQIGLAISSGAQGSDKVALDSKITASGQWTASSNGSTAGILAYSGDPGISAGRSFLLPVLTTATIPTQAATDTQVQTLITSNGTSGLTFNQIANEAILTSSTNSNAAGTGAGFSPAGSFLNGSNNVIKIGALRGATIADSTFNDNDSIVLDQSFVQTAATIAGVETLSFIGSGGGLDVGSVGGVAGTLQGVKTISFTVASRLGLGASQVSTAQIFIGTTGAVGIGSAAAQIGSFNNIFLSAANAGSLRLGSTTALTITNSLSSNNSYTLNQSAASGLFNFFAGSAATAFSLNYNSTAGATIFSQGAVSGGGDFILNFGTANGFANLTPNSASIFSFGNTGSTLVNYKSDVLAENVIANLSVSGVDTYQIATTAGGSAFSFSAQVQLKNGVISLGFGTAQTTAAIIFNNGGLNTIINGGGATANVITIGGAAANTAFKASGATDTLNLSFNTLSGVMLVSGGGFILRGDAATALTANAGIEILNLNIFGGTVTADHVIQAATTAVGTTTFNLNAAQGVSFSLSAFTRAGTALTTFGFSQADGNNTVTFSTGWTQSRVSFFDGSGNSIISLNNLNNALSLTATNTFGTANSAASTQFNTINITDGGNDVISLGGSISGQDPISGFSRANIIGMAVGDVLSFTNYTGTLNSIQVVTSNDGVSAFASAIVLFSDGIVTYVFQNTSANGNFGGGQQATANSLAAILTGNYASLGRWTLNANNIALIS
jgi:hypothetical protein